MTPFINGEIQTIFVNTEVKQCHGHRCGLLHYCSISFFRNTCPDLVNQNRNRRVKSRVGLSTMFRKHIASLVVWKEHCFRCKQKAASVWWCKETIWKCPCTVSFQFHCTIFPNLFHFAWNCPLCSGTIAQINHAKGSLSSECYGSSKFKSEF